MHNPGLEITFPRVEGYRVELPGERLSAKFGPDSVLELNPELVGPSIVHMRGIVGEGVRLTVVHLADMRQSSILFHLAKYLLYQKYRDPGEAPKLHLFGQLKTIARQWLDGGYLRCTGGTYPAQLIYQEIADMACERIKAAITESLAGERPVKAILDAHNPTGSTRFVNFTTSKETRWQTDPGKCHINWIVCDSDWEAEFCRVAESHPRARAYAKNQSLGLEIPYLLAGQRRRYIPDFIVRIDDGDPDPLNLIVEIKGYRGEDAKEKANTLRTYWVPGVNNLKKFGRWQAAEFTAVYEIEAEFESIMREEEKTPIRKAYERRNRDLDPQLVWRGKDEQDLVVAAPPLYIQEKVHPKVLIDDLMRFAERHCEPKAKQSSLDRHAAPRLAMTFSPICSPTSTACPTWKRSPEPTFCGAEDDYQVSHSCN